jgi:hypothetical protein
MKCDSCGEEVVPKRLLGGRIVLTGNIDSSFRDSLLNSDSLTYDALLRLEMWLNDEVAVMAFRKFGVGLRVHLESQRRIDKELEQV